MNVAPEPAIEALPPLPPPAYQEAIRAAHAYPPQRIPDTENRQDELPGYELALSFPLASYGTHAQGARRP